MGATFAAATAARAVSDRELKQGTATESKERWTGRQRTEDAVKKLKTQEGSFELITDTRDQLLFDGTGGYGTVSDSASARQVSMMLPTSPGFARLGLRLMRRSSATTALSIFPASW